ncbi:MAG TPA: NADH-quinone oxidoreductase subunit M [Micromonosporaceae bacterium]|nr:NADH-quinone oxidoreductase subunit M [Micromonosporaceae bacterium]
MVNQLLLWTLAVPLVGAAISALLPDLTGRKAATVFSLLTLMLAVLLGLDQKRGMWLELDWAWVPAFGLRLHLGVDGISYPLVVLTALLTMLCCGYSIWHTPRPGRGNVLGALLLLIEAGIIGTFLAQDLVLFFIAFEVVLLPMAAVIAVWGGEQRRRAALKFALYTLAGSVLLLVGVISVVVLTGSGDMVNPPPLSHNAQLWIFALFAVAFAVKSPLWPLHTWLPDAHTEAPTVGSVILAGVLLKMGTYGLIRVGLGVTPDAFAEAAPILGVLAVAAIIVGSLVCLAQTELKRLIAYSSVGHMGFVLLGIATGTKVGLQAALIGNIAHGVLTGLLFFLAGAIKDRAHTGELNELGGLREKSPWLAGILGLAALGSLGLPGLAGFWGEAFAVIAAYSRGGPLWTVLAIVAAVGAALTTVYMLRMLRKVSHGPLAPSLVNAAEARWPEVAAWAPLILLAFVLGLLPILVVDLAAGAALISGAVGK